MRTLICTLLWLFVSLCNNAFAQDENIKYYNIDVKGVPIGATVSESDILDKFGKPTRTELQDGEDGTLVWYYYGDSYLLFENGTFIEFTICDSQLQIMTRYFSGGIRVGDDISVFQNFEHGDLVLVNEDLGRYKLVDDSDTSLVIRTQGDRIEKFHFHFLS